MVLKYHMLSLLGILELISTGSNPEKDNIFLRKGPFVGLRVEL